MSVSTLGELTPDVIGSLGARNDASLELSVALRQQHQTAVEVAAARDALDVALRKHLASSARAQAAALACVRLVDSVCPDTVANGASRAAETAFVRAMTLRDAPPAEAKEGA